MADPARFELTTSAFGGQRPSVLGRRAQQQVKLVALPRFESARPQLIEMPTIRWCGRRDSNPHSLSRSRFSYHFGFRRRLVGVRGLDYPFAKAFRP